MSMNRADYHASYIRFRTFIECTGREATHSVGPHPVSPAPPGIACNTRENSTLYLCDPCLTFWRECAENGDPTTWQVAVYLRDQRHLHPSARNS